MKYLTCIFAICIMVIIALGCGDQSALQPELGQSSLMATDSIPIDKNLLGLMDKSLAPFYHGVASGDPTQTSVVIWTRVSPASLHEVETVSWEISQDENFSSQIQLGQTTTQAANDFTVKIDVQGLQAGTTYFYRFKHGNKYSMVGQTSTLPENPQQMRIAFASCSNYEWGYFHNYRFMATDSIDLIVHLGDYIYEYAPGGYGNASVNRKHVPNHEITSLQDYRTRYSQYRLDPDLMKAHASVPFITTWDDHESANNSYKDGAQNHQNDEGDWNERKAVAKKAYYEWLPVREKQPHLYRSFSLGKLANLIILDTRIDGRTKQVDSVSDPTYFSLERSILGTRQKDWLLPQLQSNHTWKIIGNQVPFGPLHVPELNGGLYLDGWDGYPAERNEIAEVLGVTDNTVIMTGDYHSSFSRTTPANDQDFKTMVATEFIVPSINSSNYDEHASDKDVERALKAYYDLNEGMEYVNLRDHGYVVLTITPESVKAEFKFATTVVDLESQQFTEAVYLVPSGTNEVLRQ